ncbi:MAG TPA: hypothetical protein VLL05_11300 [Terriglobales bacterium]|nr:hypothetical protein [Terriglobales bacterium]
MADHKSTELGSRPGHDRRLLIASVAGSTIFFLALISYNFVDIDIWHQMALIRESVRAGHLLRADPFAYTPTLGTWIDHEWGAGVIAYFTTLWFGACGLLILKFVLAFATGALCWRCSAKLGADYRLTSLCAPLAIFLAYLGFFAAVRAQVYSFFFTALLVWFWESDRRGSREWLVAWLVVFPLWVNLHGGFVLGIGLAGLYCFERFLHRENIRRMLIALAGMLLETLLTPYGASYLGYLRRALLMSRPFAAEWRPVRDLGPAWVGCFLVAVAAAVYAVMKVGLRKTPGILPLAATAVEAALHRKLLPVFAVVWLCYTPSYLQETPAGKWLLQFLARRRSFAIASWAALGCASLVSAARQEPWALRVPQPIYPVGAVQYLAGEEFRGNVMVPFRLGAYVSWKLYPAVKVALDGRYEEVYSNDVMRQIFDFYEAQTGWRATLDRYPTDVVVAPRDAPICEKMHATEWRPIYQDKEFVLYARPGLTLPEHDDRAKSFAGVLP